MKKIIFIASIICFMLPVKHVYETHDNGMPKIIKEYSTGYSKLSLSKETGYYSNGAKKYEKKYYNGKMTSSYKWDRDGKKIISSKKWTDEQKQELFDSCPKNDIEACNCGVEIIIDEFTYDEFSQLIKGAFGDDEELMKRAMDLEKILESRCGV